MGSLVGGFMMRALSPDPLTSLEVGTRATFRYLGVAAFCTGFFYFLFNQFYIRRKNARKSHQKSTDDIDVKQIKAEELAVQQGGVTNPVFIPDEDQTSVKRVNNKSLDNHNKV